jgi:regulator of protease activity HflC (stomatin/prohibitin superfamily)
LVNGNGNPSGGVYEPGRMARSISGAFLVLLIGGIAVLVLSRVGCVNLHTPPGHEGYVRSRPIAGVGSFVGIQRGPTSTGWAWRREVVNIDVRPRTFSEEMSIITAERLPLSFRAHTRIRLREGRVKDVVEKYGGADWYASNVREQLRSEVRSKVQALDAFTVKNRSIELADGVLRAMQARYADSPIEILSVDIGDIVYPDVVVQSVIRKFVTEEDNLRKDIELRIAQREIDIGIAEAEGVSDAQRIIRTTLDPMFLQYEALGAVEQLANSPNTTFVVMPMGRDGNSPVIMSLGQ